MTDTLREKALSPEEAEFARLVARGMAEAQANEQWLSGTASIKLTPFARDGLAHSFGLLLDKYDAALAEIERLREALTRVRQRARNARGAIESNQVVDKDVHGSMNWIMETIDEALRSPSA